MTVPFADRGQQLDNSILIVDMELCSILSNNENDLEAAATCNLDSVRKFYIAVAPPWSNW